MFSRRRRRPQAHHIEEELSPEEWCAAMRQTWSLVPHQPEWGPEAVSFEELCSGTYPHPGYMVRRHHYDAKGQKWGYEDYRIITAPAPIPLEEGGYFLGGGYAVSAYRDESGFTGSEVTWLSGDDKHYLATKLHNLPLSECGVIPYNTVEGQMWAKAVWLERLS